MFGFGNAKKQERNLRSSLSKDKFAVEFEKTLEHFRIQPAATASKSLEFNQIDSAAKFMLDAALSAAESKIMTADDLEAAATFSAALCDFLGRNAELSSGEILDLQSRVPGAVFPATAGRVLGAGARGAFGSIIAKGIVRHSRMGGKKKGMKVLDEVDDGLLQFISQRDKKYLKVLANNIDLL